MGLGRGESGRDLGTPRLLTSRASVLTGPRRRARSCPAHSAAGESGSRSRTSKGLPPSWGWCPRGLGRVVLPSAAGGGKGPPSLAPQGPPAADALRMPPSWPFGQRHWRFLEAPPGHTPSLSHPPTQACRICRGLRGQTPPPPPGPRNLSLEGLGAPDPPSRSAQRSRARDPAGTQGDPTGCGEGQGKASGGPGGQA